MFKFLFLLLCVVSLYALSPEEEAAEKIYIANINALLIFTSESGLSSGKYSLTKSGHSIETYSVPFRYHFEPFSKGLNLFVNGGAGFSRTRLDIPAEDYETSTNPDLNLTLDNKIQTYAFGLGAGLRYKTDYGLEILGSLGLIYSRVGVGITPDDPGSVVEDAFDSAYNDNLTYKFALACEYIKEINGFKPYIKADYKSYETKSELDFSSLIAFSTQTSSASLSLGIESPSLYEYADSFMSLETYLEGNYLFGDVKDVVELSKYLNIGAVAYWNTPNTPFWASRFYLEVSTVRAEALEGYNIGIGFSLDY